MYWNTETPLRRHSSYVSGHNVMSFGTVAAAVGTSPASASTATTVTTRLSDSATSSEDHEELEEEQEQQQEQEEQENEEEESSSPSSMEQQKQQLHDNNHGKASRNPSTTSSSHIDIGVDDDDEDDDDEDDSSSSSSSDDMDDYEPNLAFLHKTPAPPPPSTLIVDPMSPERRARKHRMRPCPSRRGGACHSDLLKSAVLATLESYESEPEESADEQVHTRSTSTSLAGDSAVMDDNSRSSRKRARQRGGDAAGNSNNEYMLYEHLQEDTNDCMLIKNMDVCCTISSRASLVSKRRPSLIHTTNLHQPTPNPQHSITTATSTSTTTSSTNTSSRAKRPSLVLTAPTGDSSMATITRPAKRPSLILRKKQDNNNSDNGNNPPGSAAPRQIPPRRTSKDLLPFVVQAATTTMAVPTPSASPKRATSGDVSSTGTAGTDASL